jgi:hypothetical protein
MELEKQALEWACKKLSLNISLPASLSSSLASGNLSPREYVPLPLVLSENINALSKGDSALLRYPLPGFLIMISAMLDLHVEPYSGARKLAVLQRFLFLLVENHCQYLAEDSNLASTSLKSLLCSSKSQDMESTGIGETRCEASRDIETSSSGSEATPAASSEASRQTQPLRLHHIPAPSSTPSHSTQRPLSLPFPITVLSLTRTHLLSFHDLETLSRLGPTFDFIKENCSWTITTFLHVFAREMKTEEEEPIDCFDRIMVLEPLKGILDGRLDFSEIDARGVIEERREGEVEGGGLPVRNKEVG